MKIFNKSKLLKVLIQLVAIVPQRFLQRVVVPVLSFILWHGRSEFRRITEINIRICFHSLNERERACLARTSISETLKTFFEFPYILMNKSEKLLDKIVHIDGQAYVDAAMSKGRGVLFLSPHLGSWEVLGLKVASEYPLTSMFKPNKFQPINSLLKSAREGGGGKLVPTNRKGVSAILRALKRGEASGILPDQIPDGGSGVEFEPFFGQTAATMTLVSGLIKKTQAEAIGCFARRLPCGNFEIVYRPVDEDLYDKDPKVSARGLNKTVESLIEIAPEQYQWIYKRFREGATGKTGIYKK